MFMRATRKAHETWVQVPDNLDLTHTQTQHALDVISAYLNDAGYQLHRDQTRPDLIIPEVITGSKEWKRYMVNGFDGAYIDHESLHAFSKMHHRYQ